MKQMRLLAASLVIMAGSLWANEAAYEVEMGDDGLHKAPWQNETFLDLREDLETAKSENKTLMIIWEQRGCIYCTKMHEEVFPIADIAQKLSDEFYVVQYNLFGDREVTDFDGEVLPEKEMAMKWRVMFTPTTMFFPEEVDEGKTADQAAVVTMPGAFGEWTTRNLLSWVREKGYEGEENFQKYHARKFLEAQEAGLAVDDN